MRQLILTTILAAGAAAALSALSVPAQAQYTHCIHGRGCVPATLQSYNACFSLALNRGLTVTVGEKRYLDYFIYECLAGRIPR